MRMRYRGLCVLAAAASACASDSPGPDATATLIVSIDEYDFGTVAIGVQSPAISVTVTNPGEVASGQLTVALDGATPDEFGISQDECEGAALPAKTACTMQLWMRPASSGAKQASVELIGREGESASIELRGAGTGSTLALLPSTTYTFLPTRVDAQSAPLTLLLRNMSPRNSGPISIQAAGDHTAEFAVIRDDCSNASLAAGTMCRIDVQFRPVGAGLRTAQLQISSPIGGGTVASLRGTAGFATTLTLTPTSVQFGTVRVGTTSAPSSFTLSNTGTTSTGNLAVVVNGAQSGHFITEQNFCITAILAPGSSCTFSVRYRPSAVGLSSGVLQVQDVFADPAQLTLAGTGAIPSLAAPEAVSFSETMVGTTSTGTIVTITNTGLVETAPLRFQVLDAYYYYYSIDAFELSNDTCSSTTLALAASCSVTVTFKPMWIGSASAVLQVLATETGLPTKVVILGGIGSGVSILPGHIDFPATAVGSSSAPVSVTVTNSAQAPTGPLSVAVDGVPFVIASDECSGVSLAGGASCTVAVRFTPSSPALWHGSLRVSGQPGGQYSIGVRGLGT